MPEEVARACAALGTSLPDGPVKRVRPELIHLTLAFVGDVPDDAGVRARDATTAALGGSGAIPARLGAAGAFPTPARPRVVWVGLAEGADAVRERALRLRTELRARRVPFDDAPPVAHLTVARLRDGATEADRAAVARVLHAATVPGLSFRLDQAVVFESRLRREGPQYLPLVRVPLAAPGA